jgi:hypothetical protein
MGEKKSMMLAVVVLLAIAAVANATPVQTLTSTATTVDNLTWTYNYTLASPVGASDMIFDLYVPAWGSIAAVTTPAGWNSFYGPGFVEWSANFGSEVTAGNSLSGFSFQTDLTPAMWPGIMVSTDDGLGNITMTDVTGLQPVPEPTAIVYTITALGFGAGFIGLRSRKSLLNK